jgi:hypothetical protein
VTVRKSLRPKTAEKKIRLKVAPMLSPGEVRKLQVSMDVISCALKGRLVLRTSLVDGSSPLFSGERRPQGPHALRPGYAAV